MSTRNMNGETLEILVDGQVVLTLTERMADETMELAKPVMGTSVPAPALAASFWYQPIAVVKADRPMSVALVSVPASVSVKPRAAYSVRRPSPKRQMAPPTKNAHRQSFKSGEGGDAAALTPNYIRLSQAERARLEANTTE